jgi:hypothetical protein
MESLNTGKIFENAAALLKQCCGLKTLLHFTLSATSQFPILRVLCPADSLSFGHISIYFPSLKRGITRPAVPALLLIDVEGNTDKTDEHGFTIIQRA